MKQISEANTKKIRERSEDLKKKIKFEFSNPRKIGEVFVSYYLMLQSLQVGKSDPAGLAKVWLRLSWLYDDVQDEECLAMPLNKLLIRLKTPITMDAVTHQLNRNNAFPCFWES